MLVIMTTDAELALAPGIRSHEENPSYRIWKGNTGAVGEAWSGAPLVFLQPSSAFCGSLWCLLCPLVCSSREGSCSVTRCSFLA